VYHRFKKNNNNNIEIVVNSSFFLKKKITSRFNKINGHIITTSFTESYTNDVTVLELGYVFLTRNII